MALCLLYEVLRQKFCFFATHNVCNSQINEVRLRVRSRELTGSPSFLGEAQGEETFPGTAHTRH